MQRRVLRRLIPAACCVGLGAAAVRGDEPVVPVYHEPHHRQVFQYGPIRILDVQIPPGDTSWFHTHAAPILYVTLSTSRLKTESLAIDRSGGRGAGDGDAEGASARGRGAGPNGGRGGAANAGPQPAGRISSTTSYADRPVAHKVQNIGEGLFHPIAVINETPGDEVSTQQATGFDGKAELTNKWFRAYRLAVDVGKSISAHRHTTPSVIIQTTEGHAFAVGPMTFDLSEPGRWAYFEPGAAHEIRNAGDTRVEFVEVEVRQPPK